MRFLMRLPGSDQTLVIDDQHHYVYLALGWICLGPAPAPDPEPVKPPQKKRKRS